MNNPSQFAQPFSWGIAAKAADARPSLLPASAATSIIHDQRDDHRRAGQPVWGRDDHLPVRVNLFRGQDLPERLGRGISLRSFSGRLSGCVNTQLANIKSTRCGHFQCVAQRLPSHSETSSRSSTYASKTIQKRRRGLGKVIRELGPVVQGIAYE